MEFSILCYLILPIVCRLCRMELFNIAFKESDCGCVKVPDFGLSTLSVMNSEESHPPANLTVKISARSECELTSDKDIMMSKTALGRNTN